MSNGSSPRRPRKRCSQCGANTAQSYHWWLEETSVDFICATCRGQAAAPAAEPLHLRPSEPFRFALDDAA
jgi:hypothetical protein